MIKKISVPVLAVLLSIIVNASAAPGPAGTPDPANGAINVPLDKVLSWVAGYGATSHDVYFGTNATAVTNAQRKANPLFKGNIVSAGYDPNLQARTTYYWRVDEVNGPQRQKGNVWSFTTAGSNYSIIGKVMCGYQGWFNCPGDGTTRGWVHWPNNDTSSFAPTNCHADMWPDTSEMTPGEKFEATEFLNDSNHYYVFSSHNHAIVMRHFQWMQQYGIDGIYLQRFANEIRDQNSKSFLHRNDVLDYCKDGANTYGRVYAVMYDLSGLKSGQTSYVITDWKYLVDTKKVTKDPYDHAYMYHKGKPVVAIWGIGFNDGRQYTLQECLDLVKFFKSDPVYGGCTVMVGVPSYWRELEKDCLNDPMVHTIILAADIVSPWSVGRYTNSTEISTYTNNVWTKDVTWCQSHNIEYLPVIFPGYSHHHNNRHSNNHPLNQIPRSGGQFFWSQVSSTITAAGANMLYVAMFDEVDEGTAIFKVSNNPPRPDGVDTFVTYNMDGYSLPSDEYLWLVGQAGRALRGEIPVNATRPARP